MTNNLPDKDKASVLPQSDEAGKPVARADFGAQALGAYGQTTGKPIDLSKESWDGTAKKTALQETPKGRAVIRAFSRGILGTAAFTLGGWYATRQMVGYAPFKPTKNFVQGIAKVFDYGVGVPLKGAVNLLGHDGEAFVNHFRPSVEFGGYGPGKLGRSLGHEVVMVTFDFASMSIGDFWGRKLVHSIDPNDEPVTWKREDGSIDWLAATKRFAKNWWTAITYSAGEDWAVAVPYVLTMHHLGRPLMNKMSPGFCYEFDRNGFGGGMTVDDQGRVRGNYTKAGLLNLWERFTTYNVGTLMFREAYNWVGGRIRQGIASGKMPPLIAPDPYDPPQNTTETAVDVAQNFTRWVARSTIKAVTYMIPAVPFFWITRTPQHKFQGMFVHPEKGVLMVGENQVLRANASLAERLAPAYYSMTREAAVNPFVHGEILPNAHTWGPVDKLLNPIAKAADGVRDTLRKPLGKGINKVFNIKNGESFADTYINASMAYTPYFWAKSDWLADKWDQAWMDVGLERALHGVATFNPGEFSAGCGEIWRALQNKPLEDPQRELYAQCREATDDTPSDNKFSVNPHAGQSCDFLIGTPAAVKAKEAPAPVAPNWRERIVQGRPEDKPEIAADRPTGYAEQEAMRKALAEMTPPTSSIH